jgi:hypothetical protein
MHTSGLCEATYAIDAEAARLCAGLSSDELCWRPRPRRWSIAENLAHLRITADVFLPVVDIALATTRQLKLVSEGPFSLNMYGRLLKWRIESRPIIRMRSPALLLPRLGCSPDGELEHFLVAQAALRQRIAEAQGLNLTAFRFSSPVASYLRINLLEFFLAFNAHAQRHLRQAHRVRGAMLRFKID